MISLNKNEAIKSPVTSQGVAKLIETIPVQQIVDGYQKLLDIDVREYFGDLEQIGIYKCGDTGLRFYYPPTIFADEKFYAFLQKKEFYYSEWNWEHTVALQNLVPQSRILEVGCGTGSFLLRLKQEGFECAGLELNEAAAEVCQKKGLTVYNELLGTHLVRHTGYYDAVCAFQVLEHVYDIQSFINECLQCLKPGGKLIFGVPNNNPFLYKYDKYHTLNLPPHHSGLWNRRTFQQLPDFFPFRVDKIKAEPLFNRDNYLHVWLKHIGATGLSKQIKKIRPGIINRLLWPLKFFAEGKSVVAIFNKNR